MADIELLLRPVKTNAQTLSRTRLFVRFVSLIKKGSNTTPGEGRTFRTKKKTFFFKSPDKNFDKKRKN